MLFLSPAATKLLTGRRSHDAFDAEGLGCRIVFFFLAVFHEVIEVAVTKNGCTVTYILDGSIWVNEKTQIFDIRNILNSVAVTCLYTGLVTSGH